jgi:hypothetical protein
MTLGNFGEVEQEGAQAMFIRICTISAGLALGMAAAQAQDRAPSDIGWTGFYAGLGVGGSYNWADLYSESDDYDWNRDYFFQSLHTEDGDIGWFGTGETGFDWQLGSWVVGIGASYDASQGGGIFDSVYWDDTDGSCSEDDFG